MNLPTDVAQQALDAAAVDYTLGDIEDGSRPAQVLLRAYGQCLRQLLRSAHWDFARKQAPMVLLADATGQTPYVGSIVPVPWIYEYEYPQDCAKARFIPWNQASQTPGIPQGNIQIGQQPLVTGLGQQPLAGQRIVPARFTIATDYNYPQPAQSAWEVPGISPQGRTVVLTNVRGAALIYTAVLLWPNVWDPLFRAAFVAYLASEVALPLAKDKKLGMAMRSENIKIAQGKIQQARLTDGNEGWFSSDIKVDWMQYRTVGGGMWSNGGWGAGQGGAGCIGYGFDSCGFSDGSAY